jgi:cation diffusion facilitator family transporter
MASAGHSPKHGKRTSPPPPDARASKPDGGHGGSTKAVVAALGSNLAIAAAKFAGFLVTHSSSMLAESVHSFADTGNQFLLLLGSRRAKRAADSEHPFGYGRERYFWAFVVALVLFTMGAMFAVFEGIEKIRHPHPITDTKYAFAILGFAILAEGFSFRTARRESKADKGNATFRQYIRNAKSPELPVVLLEDTAALCGLAFALAALITAVKTGNPVWDGYGTVAIGALLGVVAIVLAWEMKSLLIGESASPKVQEAIKAAIEIEPGVMGLIHMRTEHLGPDELLVCAKVEFEHQLTLPEVAEAVDRVERNVRENVPSARLMYIEPDVARDKRAAPVVPEHTGDHPISAELRARLEAEREALERPKLPPAR